MIIPKELLTYCKDNNYGYVNMSSVNNEDIAILAIIELHRNKKISYKKMMAMFKQYRSKTLIRKINTYHCKINNKWYSDGGTFTAIMDSYNELCIKEDFSIETCLKYFNLLFNMNKNYCIDHLYFAYFKQIIQGMNNYQGHQLLNLCNIDNINVMSYDDFKQTWQATSGYCCEDCDGPICQYMSNRYENHLGYNYQDNFKNLVKNKLNSMKTTSGLKNPQNRLNIHT
jgi:hypothetical protein